VGTGIDASIVRMYKSAYQIALGCLKYAISHKQAAEVIAWIEQQIESKRCLDALQLGRRLIFPIGLHLRLAAHKQENRILRAEL